MDNGSNVEGDATLRRAPAPKLLLPGVIAEVRHAIFFNSRRSVFFLVAATAVLPLALSHALLSASSAYPAIAGSFSSPSATTFLARSILFFAAVVYSILSIASLTHAATAKEDPTASAEAFLSSVPPRLWMRLGAIILLGAAAHAGLYGATALLVTLSGRAFGPGTTLGLVAFILICLAHVAALVAVGVVRHLAAAACALGVDGASGFGAFRISAALVRGREWEASAAFLAHHVPFAAAEAVFGAVLLSRSEQWDGVLGLSLWVACLAVAVLVMTAALTSGITVAAAACVALLGRDDLEEAGGLWQVAGPHQNEKVVLCDADCQYYVPLKGTHHQAGWEEQAGGAVGDCQA